MEEFGKLVNQVGLAGAILVIVGVFFWRIIVRIDSVFLSTEKDSDGKAKGRIIRAIDEHVETMKSVRKNADAQTDVLQRLEHESQQKVELLKELKEADHEIILGIDRIEDRIKGDKGQ